MKSLLTTTAIIMSLGTSAMAASHEAAEADAETGMATESSEPAPMTAETEAEAGTEMAVETDTAATPSDTASMPADDTGMVPVREGYEMIDPQMAMSLTSENLLDVAVYDMEDERIGEVGEVIIGDEGKIDQIVIQVGGFLGIGEKPVAFDFTEAKVMKEAEGDDYVIYLPTSQEALEAMPKYISEQS